MKKKLPITLLMVVYNEEKLLERALQSAKDIVNEIIIMHDGKCSDNTLKIARKYTDRVYILKHDGFCDSHRVEGIKKAKNDWVFFLDADEYLSKDLQKELPRLVNNNVNVGIYEFLWPIKFRNKLHYSMYKSALFRKSRVYFIGAIHEYVKPLSKDVKIQRTNLRLLHAPETDNYTIKTFKKKNIKWAFLQAIQLVRSFSEIKTWNYTSNDWDYPTNLRVKHPFIFGIIASSLYHFIISLIESFRKDDIFYLWKGTLMSFYFIILYSRVIYLKLSIDETYD